MRGFESVLDASVIQFCLAENQDHEGLLEIINQSHPDMIAAVGSTAALFATRHIADIPIVYFMVMNPDKYLLQARNTHGVVLNQDPLLMLEMLEHLNISARRIGTLSSQAMQNSFALSRMQQAVAAKGMSLNIIKIKSSNQSVGAIEALVKHNDAIILLPDRTVITARTFRRMVEICREYRVPLLVPAGLFVKLGGLASFAYDASDIGKQAAEIANRILQGDTVPQVEYPRHNQLVLNRTTVKWNRLRLPRSLLLGAKLYD
ncbi:MAG: ABC transporter substrate binding protein [Mariprofundus sp.]|nr:ABC transporter substrate binding protein [Mariprofundus sp.]